MEFNTREFGWKDITVNINGKVFNGITEVEFVVKQEKSYLYGRGENPHQIGRGNKSYEGKIAIHQSELLSMLQQTGIIDPLDLKFIITVSFAKMGTTLLSTYILYNVELTEVKKGMKQGDKNMIIELPIMFTRLHAA